MAFRARAQTAPRVALAADDERTASEAARVAEARGVPFERLRLEAAIEAPVGAIAYAPAAPPDGVRAVALAPLCQIAAENRKPVVMLCAFDRARGKTAEERAASLAYLRAHGAILVEDPDVWFEAATLMAAFGAPPGPRVAVVAPPGGWLHLQATALALEEESRGGARLPVASTDDENTPPADIVLVDGGLTMPASDRVGRALVVPVAARAEMLGQLATASTALVGLRQAVAAAIACGRHAERLAQGLGPAPVADAKRLKPDRARVDKVLAPAAERLGDHETKRLLAAYGAAVTRQAVATTPSAASRFAEELEFPVEVKPWDASAATEREGGVVMIARNAPDVRRAFASVSSQAGFAVGSPVIVRAMPAGGRELSARVERLPDLGWTVVVDVPGAARPLAAPAPLRKADADELTTPIESSRAGDAPPDRAALADLLVRASFAAVDCEEDVDAIDLARIVCGAKGAGATVVDARVRLKKKRDRVSR